MFHDNTIKGLVEVVPQEVDVIVTEFNVTTKGDSQYFPSTTTATKTAGDNIEEIAKLEVDVALSHAEVS